MDDHHRLINELSIKNLQEWGKNPNGGLQPSSIWIIHICSLWSSCPSVENHQLRTKKHCDVHFFARIFGSKIHRAAFHDFISKRENIERMDLRWEMDQQRNTAKIHLGPLGTRHADRWNLHGGASEMLNDAIFWTMMASELTSQSMDAHSHRIHVCYIW